MGEVQVNESGLTQRGASEENAVGKPAAIGRLAVGQQTALELLVAGKSITATAREAGVSRTTLYQWMRNDPAFQAAYNQWQIQMEDGCRARLLTLTDKATEAIERALENGDARVALQLLKGMGLMARKEVGSTNEEEIRERSEIERKERKIGMRREKGKLRMDDLTADGGW